MQSDEVPIMVFECSGSSCGIYKRKSLGKRQHDEFVQGSSIQLKDRRVY